MTDLQLIRSTDDRRRYDLPGVGSLRLPKRGSRAVAATPVTGFPLTFHAHASRYEATDTMGSVVGSAPATLTYEASDSLIWVDARYALDVTTRGSRTAFVLSSGDTPLAVIEPYSDARTKAAVGLGGARVEAGLLLFATWIAQTLREQSVTGDGGGGDGGGDFGGGGGD